MLTKVTRLHIRIIFSIPLLLILSVSTMSSSCIPTFKTYWELHRRRTDFRTLQKTVPCSSMNNQLIWLTYGKRSEIPFFCQRLCTRKTLREYTLTLSNMGKGLGLPSYRPWLVENIPLDLLQIHPCFRYHHGTGMQRTTN